MSIETFKYKGDKSGFGDLCEFCKHDKRCSGELFDIMKFSLASSAVFMITIKTKDTNEKGHYRLVPTKTKSRTKQHGGNHFLHVDDCYIAGISIEDGNLVFNLTYEDDLVSKFSDDKWDDLKPIKKLKISRNGTMILYQDAENSISIKSVKFSKPDITLATWHNQITNGYEGIWNDLRHFMDMKECTVTMKGSNGIPCDVVYQLKPGYHLVCGEYRKRSLMLTECNSKIKGTLYDLYDIDHPINEKDGFQLVHLPLRLACLKIIEGGDEHGKLNSRYIIKEVVFTGKEYHGFDYYAEVDNGYVLLETDK